MTLRSKVICSLDWASQLPLQHIIFKGWILFYYIYSLTYLTNILINHVIMNTLIIKLLHIVLFPYDTFLEEEFQGQMHMLLASDTYCRIALWKCGDLYSQTFKKPCFSESLLVLSRRKSPIKIIPEVQINV